MNRLPRWFVGFAARQGATLTDPTLRALLNKYGEVVTRKLVLIIAWFNLLSLILNGCRVPMEVTDSFGSKKSPLE